MATAKPARTAKTPSGSPTQASRDQSEKAGTAMKGGRFPVNSKDDLRRAIQAVGRAKGGEAGRKKVRQFIIRRAKALGLSNMIPDNWNPDGSLKN
jgi:hypothetical protein